MHAELLESDRRLGSEKIKINSIGSEWKETRQGRRIGPFILVWPSSAKGRIICSIGGEEGETLRRETEIVRLASMGDTKCIFFRRDAAAKIHLLAVCQCRFSRIMHP